MGHNERRDRIAERTGVSAVEEIVVVVIGGFLGGGALGALLAKYEVRQRERAIEKALKVPREPGERFDAYVRRAYEGRSGPP